ncbi:hypothetical protein ACLB2K_069600 [Fragaria x ananassa]
MKKFKSMLKPKPNPTEQLKDWQRRLRQESRNIERQIRDLEREEKVVQKAIREAAKRNDMGSAKSLAREILGSRKAVSRLQENKAQLNSISMHLGESVALARTVGHLSKSTEVMKLVNDLTRAPEMAVTMQQFTKEITKAGLIEEFVNDALDTTLDSEDMEEETEEEVEKVLSEIAGETAAQLPEAVRKERTKLPAHVATASQEEQAIAEGSDDEEELEALRARLAQVRSTLPHRGSSIKKDAELAVTMQESTKEITNFQGSNSGWGAKISRQEPLGRLQGLPGSIYFQVLPRISSAVSALVKGGISSLI